MQSQEWEVKFFVPQATNSIWRWETRTMVMPMRLLSVGNLYGSGFSIAVGVVLTTAFTAPIDRQKRPETISFEVRSIGIDQKRSV